MVFTQEALDEIGYRVKQSDILTEILDERDRQDTKWGKHRRQSAYLWQAILAEESGEVARGALEQDLVQMRAELVQVAAVALAIIEAIDEENVLLEE